MTTLETISTIDDIVTLVKEGFTNWRQFGYVTTKQSGDLILFNYTAGAQYKGDWNFFERVSRGLIIHTKTGEIVARPFDKFFNWGEGERFSTAPIKYVAEKIDGSMVFTYICGEEICFATRGSFDSDQAKWAKEFFYDEMSSGEIEEFAEMFRDYTCIFEVFYPENRIVLEYENNGLFLLAIRNRHTGEYLDHRLIRHFEYYFNHTFDIVNGDMGQLKTVESVLDECQTHLGIEGYVVEFADGQRFKFKTPEYLRLHKLIFSLSFNGVLSSLRDGTLDGYIAEIPDEFLGDVRRWVSQINTQVEAVKADVERAFSEAPKESRKDFSVWVQANHSHLKSYLFCMLDGGDIRQSIYVKHEFKKGWITLTHNGF